MNLRLDAHPVRRVLVCAAFALACASCQTNRPSTQPSPLASAPIEPVAPHAAAIEETPDWVGQPLSWEKLRTIENWLGSTPPESHGFWQVEGELQLAQGRFELARREKTGKNVSLSQITARIRAARAGFERVAKDPAATEGQQQRAQSLIASADKLLDGKRGTPVNALAKLGIVSRATWHASAPRTERMEKNKGGWRRITVHHSAEENAPELDGSIAETADAIRQMQKSHMESKSPRWGDIGYHFLIDPAGHIFQGRELTWQGAHADGDNNIQNIGICLIGNFDEERPTRAALDSLRKLLDTLRAENSIASSAVYGHQDLKSTRCPGKYLEPWVKNYAR